uniref:UDP-N-acetylglucosamine transferase subunit ALG14 homolog isoform X1 n=1 Tax=Myodes glareolus TaxID=447135 RepID=UPI002020DCCA|nr:UDP-N-acetylglucosamine transferase subunit ALG14 homolog isoform X1 [Myodes glareolus]
MVSFLILAAAAGAIAILLVARLCVVLQPHHVTLRESVGLLIVAGSGGHTTEILRLVGSLSSAYSPRDYVIADSDEMSAKKIVSFEDARKRDSATECTLYRLHRIPRSREVRQAWLSSVFTTLYATWFSFLLVCRIKPDLGWSHFRGSSPGGTIATGKRRASRRCPHRVQGEAALVPHTWWRGRRGEHNENKPCIGSAWGGGTCLQEYQHLTNSCLPHNNI